MGIIFDIKHFAVHDGPGIRTTVHFKGCPLSCQWCHNPEGIDPQPFVTVKKVKMGELTFNQEEWVGKSYGKEELLDLLMKDRLFWDESGGGVTFSGGEPLMQFDFMMQILPMLKKKNVHVALDTSAFIALPKLKQIAPFIDLFLLDLKLIDNKLHRKFTGVSNQLILENINWLISENYKLRIRIPVIPGKNFNKEALADFLTFLDCKQVEGIDLLPFHAIATAKYARFEMNNQMEGIPSMMEDELNEWKEQFEYANFKVNIGG